MDVDLSGEWIFDGHPWDAPYAGQIQMRLTQSGTSLSGDLVQLVHPLTGKAPRDPEATRAQVEGEVIEDTRASNHLVLLKRINQKDAFRAVFLGALNETQNSISGTFKNTIPGGGTFVMVKRG